jgi:methylase of polypeptide subunit release factors
MPTLFARVTTRLWLGIKRPFLKRRLGRPAVEVVDDSCLIVLPGVHNPAVFRSGALLARNLDDLVAKHAGPLRRTALDMGTGSGIGAVFAARLGYDVIGVDINPAAIRCARANVALNGVDDQCDMRLGDLFEPVADETFDLVLFNPPFFRGEPTGTADAAWRSTDVPERFAAGLPSALEPDGVALVVLSTDGDQDGILVALRQHGLSVDAALQHDFGNEVMTVYAVHNLGSSGRSP